MSIEQIQSWCTWFVAFLAVTTPAMLAARPIAIAWLESSSKTATKLDDEAAGALLKLCDAFAWVVALMPRVTMGLGEARRLRDAVKAIEKPVTR